MFAIRALWTISKSISTYLCANDTKQFSVLHRPLSSFLISRKSTLNIAILTYWIISKSISTNLCADITKLLSVLHRPVSPLSICIIPRGNLSLLLRKPTLNIVYHGIFAIRAFWPISKCINTNLCANDTHTHTHTETDTHTHTRTHTHTHTQNRAYSYYTLVSPEKGRYFSVHSLQ